MFVCSLVLRRKRIVIILCEHSTQKWSCRKLRVAWVIHFAYLSTPYAATTRHAVFFSADCSYPTARDRSTRSYVWPANLRSKAWHGHLWQWSRWTPTLCCISVACWLEWCVLGSQCRHVLASVEVTYAPGMAGMRYVTLHRLFAQQCFRPVCDSMLAIL